MTGVTVHPIVDWSTELDDCGISCRGRRQQDPRRAERVVSALPQRLEERLRRDEIGRVKPLGEATIHGCQQLARLGRLALSAPQPGQARGAPPFPGQRVLAAPPLERILAVSLAD